MAEFHELGSGDISAFGAENLMEDERPMTAQAGPAGAWADRPVNPQRLQAILEHAGPQILDVGCGNGGYVRRLQNDYDTVGLDIAPYREWASSTNRFVVGNAERLCFPDESFDTVTCFETLEHLPNPDMTLRECRRVARRNVILSVPNCDVSDALQRSNLTYYHWTDRTHINFFTAASLEKFVRKAGFGSVTVRLINELTLAPLLADISGLPEWTFRILRHLVPFRAQRHYITCLAVCEK